MFGFGGLGFPTALVSEESDDPVKWRGKRTATQCLHFICLSEHLADVWFDFEDSNVRLPAHKFVLSMRSEVFETMFYGQQTAISPEVHIDDISSNVMEKVLRYLYTDEVKLDDINVFSFLYVAKKYVLEGLHELCVQNLIKSVKADNACDIYEKVQGYDIKERVSEACLEYIWHHAWKVFKTEGFRKISRKTLAAILENDSLTGEEILTFRAVMTWAEYQAASNDVQPTPETLQELIGGAVYAVRFPLMSIEEFKEEVEPSGVLSANDVSSLSRYMQEKDAGLNVEVEKFNCTPRMDGIMTETIFNAYPFPDRVPGGCDQIYDVLFMTTEDIRLHSMTGPLINDIVTVKMTVHDRPGIEYPPPSKEMLDMEDNWTPVNYSVQNEEIIFTNDPIMMPDCFTFVRIELGRRPGAEQAENANTAATPRKGKGRRVGRQNRGGDFPILRVTNMSLIIKKTTISLTYIPPGITQMSFR